jgi:hypothetical protein
MLIPYEGDDSWVDGTITAAHECLMSDAMPGEGAECDYCLYRRLMRETRER